MFDHPKRTQISFGQIQQKIYNKGHLVHLLNSCQHDLLRSHDHDPQTDLLEGSHQRIAE